MTLRAYVGGPTVRVLSPEEISRHDARAAAREAGLLLGLAYRQRPLT